MSGVLIPLWVTYSLAVIAILGPIGGAILGAWLSARRDDKRWEREREREDVRWQRERDKQWHEHRLKIYSEFVAICDEWKRNLIDCFAEQLERGRDLSEDQVREVRKAGHEARQKLATLQIASSGEIGVFGHKLLREFVIAERVVLHGMKPDPEGEKESEEVTMEEIIQTLDIPLMAVIFSMRTEMGIEPLI